MGYDLSDRLVIGVASSALFDLTESDAVFREQGEAAYRHYSQERLDEPLAPGVAFGFVRRLLTLRDLDAGDPPVEVIIMSRNSPDTGLRVMRSVVHHSLPITRAVFTQGESPHRFMPALNMALFLSADEASVREAVELGLPAGQVLDHSGSDDGGDAERRSGAPPGGVSSEVRDDGLRIAFDFDGVLASDESERIFQSAGLQGFQDHEAARAQVPLATGPLHRFLLSVSKIQELEEARLAADATYRRRVHIALVTARSVPAHERAMASLRSWGVTVNDAFFLGGVEKAPVLEALAPHIFFDDQMRHLSSGQVPSVHVPYGVVNQPGGPSHHRDAALTSSVRA